MSADQAWFALAVLAPLGLAAIVGLLRGYAIRVWIYRELKDDEPKDEP